MLLLPTNEVSAVTELCFQHKESQEPTILYRYLLYTDNNITH